MAFFSIFSEDIFLIFFFVFELGGTKITPAQRSARRLLSSEICNDRYSAVFVCVSRFVGEWWRNIFLSI